jgi:hypothetical protein
MQQDMVKGRETWVTVSPVMVVIELTESESQCLAIL